MKKIFINEWWFITWYGPDDDKKFRIAFNKFKNNEGFKNDICEDDKPESEIVLEMEFGHPDKMDAFIQAVQVAKKAFEDNPSWFRYDDGSRYLCSK